MFEKKRLIAIGIAVMLVAFGTLMLSGCKESEPEPEPEPISAAEAVGKAFEDAGIEMDEETKAVIESARTKAEQAVCPIMGNAIDKSISTEYKGQKVYFCCAMCIDTFNKEPEKYLSKLPQFGDK
jgi:YHS domain-containing protein